MVDGALERAIGAGKAKVHTATVSVADGGTYDTGLQDVQQATADVNGNNAGTAANLATVASIAGGVLTFDVMDVDGTAGGAAQATAQDVDVVAVGE